MFSHLNKLKTTLKKFKREAEKPNNAILIIESGLLFISLWNVSVGLILRALFSVIKIGVNIDSQNKAERRMKDIIGTIEKIIRKQQTGETNYEAALICPELFRNALLIDDEDRAKEHLALIEMLFSSNKWHFDNLAETLRLVNQLSSMEYKILKLIPPSETKWDDILEIKEISLLFDTQKEHLTAVFLSLINMNLVVRKLVIRHDGGPELGTIHFDDELEYIRLSAYGELFLEIMEEIKLEREI